MTDEIARITELRDALQRSIDAHDTITVRYFGGSTPGSERIIVPIAVDASHLRARQAGQSIVKTFALDRLELAQAGQPSTLAAVTAAPQTYSDFASIAAAVADRLAARGYAVLHDEHGVYVHRYGKHRKLLKASALALTHQPVVTQNFVDVEGNEMIIEKPSVRPWRVDTAAFSDFNRAQLKFLDLAGMLADTTTPLA